MTRKYGLTNRDDYSLFDPFFDDFFLMEPHEMHRGEIMKADISEHDDHYLIDIDVPSIKKEDIKIELKDGYLTVRAQKNYNNDEKSSRGKYLRRERFSGSYSRSFYIGDDVTNEDISANLENGTLSISVKKVEEKKPAKQYIEIK